MFLITNSVRDRGEKCRQWKRLCKLCSVGELSKRLDFKCSSRVSIYMRKIPGIETRDRNYKGKQLNGEICRGKQLR